MPAPVLTASAAGANAIELNWNSVAGAVRYELWTWTTAGGWERLDDGSLTGASFTHGALAAGTTYHYAVRAVAADGTASPWSEFAYATASGLPAAPTSTPTATSTPTSTSPASGTATSTPTATASSYALSIPNLTAAATANGVLLNWETVTGAVRYELWTWWDAGVGWQAIGGGSLSGTTYTHTDVTAGTTYYYSIRALNSAGETSAWLEPYPSATALAVTGAGTSTPTPTSTATAAPGTSTFTPAPTVTATVSTDSVPTTPSLTVQATTRGVELSWESAPGAVRYELSVWWAPDPGWQPIGGGSLTGTNYTHADVTAGTTYYFSIRSLNAVGEASAWLEPYPSATAGAVHGTATPTPTATPTSTATPTPAITPTPTITPTPATTERGALIALYEATDGPNWIRSDNWLTDAPLDTWFGVTADRLDRVSRLRLRGNSLNGYIPDLSALTNVRILELSHNSLPGPFPDLSALVHLSDLDLQNIGLTGPVPDLSGNASLAWLNLASNSLNGSLPDRDSLPSLISLYLNYNQFTGTIPPGLGELHDLSSLYLGHNQLTGCIPASLKLVESHDLDTLGLPYCAEPTPTPGPTPTPATTEKGALIALYEATDGANWSFSQNWLTDKPISVWYGVTTDGSGQVVKLSLSGNNLNGAIPDLSALSHLRELRLSANDLSGSIPNMNALTDLWELDLQNNELSGTIPDMSALSYLRKLRLYGNRLTGTIPDLSALTNLSELVLGANELSGPFPDLSQLDNLTYLHLSNNNLSGPIPNLSSLTNLTHLIAGGNELTGEFPILSPIGHLRAIVLSGNQLSGRIPSLSGHTDLDNLSLSRNQFSGQIPELNSLTSLRRLSLYSNQLSGEIPDLSALTQLTGISLENNRLTGPIPDLSNLTLLLKLELQNNQLTGPILNLDLLPNLTFIRLEDNMLTGPIPDLSALSSLRVLGLDRNSLCLPEGQTLTHPNPDVAIYLNSLNPSPCTEADLAAIPETPQNLAATVGVGQVALSWDAADNAVSYELRTWDSIDRQWSAIGGILTSTAYTHTVQTDGRNYLYQVRAKGASDARSAWSERVYVSVVPTQFPPPPLSLGFDLVYQKYLEIDGVVIVGVSEVTDAKMIQAREIITGMLANRADLLESMVYYNTTLYFNDDAKAAAYRIQTSEGQWWGTNLPETETYCYVILHEFAHLIHFALEDQEDGAEFNAKLEALHDSALTAGLWNDAYASVNFAEYWAEIVTFWLEERVVATEGGRQLKVEDYDPEAVKLVKEELGAVTVPSECKR